MSIFAIICLPFVAFLYASAWISLYVLDHLYTLYLILVNVAVGAVMHIFYVNLSADIRFYLSFSMRSCYTTHSSTQNTVLTYNVKEEELLLLFPLYPFSKYLLFIRMSVHLFVRPFVCGYKFMSVLLLTIGIFELVFIIILGGLLPMFVGVVVVVIFISKVQKCCQTTTLFVTIYRLFL